MYILSRLHEYRVRSNCYIYTIVLLKWFKALMCLYKKRVRGLSGGSKSGGLPTNYQIISVLYLVYVRRLVIKILHEL